MNMNMNIDIDENHLSTKIFTSRLKEMDARKKDFEFMRKKFQMDNLTMLEIANHSNISYCALSMKHLWELRHAKLSKKIPSVKKTTNI